MKDAVIKYEQRLDNVSVSMTYIREERLIYVTVKGVIIKRKKIILIRRNSEYGINEQRR